MEPLQAAGGTPLAAGLFTVALALVHLFAGRLRLSAGRRRRWLSAAGGASVAYVFVLLLPEVSEAALLVGERLGEAFLAEQLVYLAALVGFVAFYGIEVTVAHRRGDVEISTPVYWGHLLVFALYSALIGYLLFNQERPGFASLFFYALAMALHFAVTDHGLRRHHGAAFDRVGRWILAGSTVVGAIAGAVFEVSGLTVAILYGFVVGAVVLNVLKEELPDLVDSRFVAFSLGAAAYSVVLLLV